MKFVLTCLIILGLGACKDKTSSYSKKEALSTDVSQEKAQDPGKIKFIHRPEFQALLDSADVVGSILIYDTKNNVYCSNDFEWAGEGRLPASTYKISNSIIGLETGEIESEQTIFKWDGEEKWLKAWEQDLILRDAFQFSCLPCYRELARKIGPDRMNDYVSRFEYGQMDIDSSTIGNFWVQGTSRITQLEQISFLRRLYHRQLPISERTENIMKDVMYVEDFNGYRLYAKTGLSNVNNAYNGWYVGYLTGPNNTYFFATNVSPGQAFDFSTFVQQRIKVTKKAFDLL